MAAPDSELVDNGKDPAVALGPKGGLKGGRGRANEKHRRGNVRPENDRSAPAYATRLNLIVLPIVVAVATLAVFVWRDGFGWGDVLGALVIGIGVFVALAMLRRSASR